MRASGGAILAAVLGLSCRPSGDRETRDFERMRRQQRYNVFDTSRFFPNGAVVQVPPAHTISRDPVLAGGQVRSIAFSTGAAAGSDVATVPITIDDRTRRLGADQYRISCAACHGEGGFGGGPMAPNLSERRPPSLRTARVAAMPVGMLFRIITDGFGRMPPYGWQLSPATRWAVVAHVRSLDSLPTTSAFRSDSMLAVHLQQLDSLRAARADLNAILRWRRQVP